MDFNGFIALRHQCASIIMEHVDDKQIPWLKLLDLLAMLQSMLYNNPKYSLILIGSRL